MTSAPPDIYSQADLLVGCYERAGYARVSPAIVQPAEPFLDLAGEDMRRHMFLLADSAGHELCLRPDLTIPVARDYLASAAAARPAGFCYLGAVFRDRGAGFPSGSGEFLPAGIESFGRADTAAADAEALSLGLEATAHYGVADPAILTGDVSLFSALIAALELAPAWKRRLLKDFNRKATLAEDLQRLAL
jgi:ATP phosphoribosyltransferase regulatory subunit